VTGSAPRQAYSREEARRLLNVSERQLRSWERQQLIPSAAVYGFRELVALRTLIKLRRDRVPAAQIKQALAALAQKLRHIEDPLTELRLYTDGKKIHVEVEGRAMEAVSGQLLLDFDRNELKRLVEFKAKDEWQSGREQRKEAERWFQRGLELEQAGAPADQVITKRVSGWIRSPPERWSTSEPFISTRATGPRRSDATARHWRLTLPMP